jgi:DNA helicase HerA-like ATPase
MSNEKFNEIINNGYGFKGTSITLGGAVYNNEPQAGVHVKAALRTINRHGLIAGATGTGKTKTIQTLTESLSDNGVSVIMMDIKGDFSGVSQAGTMNDRIKERHDKLGIEWNAQQYPVEFLTISKENGVRMRATVSEFGPVLFSKVLGLNDTQSGIVSIIFKYCDDNQLPLLDLKDFKKVVNYITNEGKDEITKNYGNIATQSAGTILRNVLTLEQQGADLFFGEKSFEVEDLCRINERGQGMINILRLNDIPDKPQLFSTFMLSLLAEIYATFPEEGDVDAPKLVFFIDEAHLIFNEASKALMQQMETIIKLIRSKGIGIVFCTQNPIDIPQSILAQLGFKIQHALRAFTANDRKAIKQCAQNYPETEFYKTEDLLTQLGIGEALVTVLDERGAPTPLVHTMLCAPKSRMDTISKAELDAIVSTSKLAEKYNEVVDRDSAFEMLTKKLENAAAIDDEADDKANDDAPKGKGKKDESGGVMDTVGDMVNSGVGKIIMREVTRGLLGVLGLGGSTRRKTTRSRGLFG